MLVATVLLATVLLASTVATVLLATVQQCQTVTLTIDLSELAVRGSGRQESGVSSLESAASEAFSGDKRKCV